MRFVVHIAPEDMGRLPADVQFEVARQLPRKIARERQRLDIARQRLESENRDLRDWVEIEKSGR